MLAAAELFLLLWVQ